MTSFDLTGFDYRRRLWIAHAPAGKWSSGPAVLYDFEDTQEIIDKYKSMGYGISGPYVLSETDGKIGDLK